MDSYVFLAHLKNAFFNQIEPLKNNILNGIATDYPKAVGALNTLTNLFNDLEPFHAKCLNAQNANSGNSNAGAVSAINAPTPIQNQTLLGEIVNFGEAVVSDLAASSGAAATSSGAVVDSTATSSDSSNQ